MPRLPWLRTDRSVQLRQNRGIEFSISVGFGVAPVPLKDVAEKPSSRTAPEVPRVRREEILDAAAGPFAEHGSSDAVTLAPTEPVRLVQDTHRRHSGSGRGLCRGDADRVRCGVRGVPVGLSAGVIGSPLRGTVFAGQRRSSGVQSRDILDVPFGDDLGVVLDPAARPPTS
jgi:hypothetical protein